MITLEQLANLLSDFCEDDGCFCECYDAFQNNLLTDELGSGSLSASDALMIFKQRAWTTQRAKVKTWGFERTIEQLAKRSPDEVIILRHLTTPEKHFTIFLSESDQVIGCVGIVRRNRRREDCHAG